MRHDVAYTWYIFVIRIVSAPYRSSTSPRKCFISELLPRVAIIYQRYRRLFADISWGTIRFRQIQIWWQEALKYFHSQYMRCIRHAIYYDIFNAARIARHVSHRFISYDTSFLPLGEVKIIENYYRWALNEINDIVSSSTSSFIIITTRRALKGKVYNE